jgi:hypothetical protein
MLDRLATLAHGERVRIEALLYSVQQVLMLAHVEKIVAFLLAKVERRDTGRSLMNPPPETFLCEQP